MSLERLAFAYEICKIAQAKSKKRRGYGAALVATAPAALAQSAADYPKGWVDRKVEVGVAKGLKPALKARAWKTGTGRALGRLVAGPVTAPLFFSGIKDLKEGKNREGAAKVLAASGAYSSAKGGVEAAYKNRGTKLSRTQIKSVAKRVAGTRGLIGLGSGLVTATGIAKSQKDGSNSVSDRIAKPALIGAVVGAPKGALERVAIQKSLRAPRKILGAAAGRSASGVVGALALSEAIRLVSKPGKIKEANVDPAFPQIAPTAGQIYSQTRTVAKKAPDEILQDFLKGTKAPEATPAKRAMTYAVNDELRARGHQVPKEKIRSQTHPPMVKGTNFAHVAAVAAVIAAPSLVWELGISNMSVAQKDLALRDALDQMVAKEGIERIEASISQIGTVRFGGRTDAFYLQAYGAGDQKKRDEWAGKLEKSHSKETLPTQAKVRDFAGKLRGGKSRFISSAPDAPVSTIAHELGHATAGELRRKTIASPLSKIVYSAARIPAIALPLVVLDSASDKSFHTKEEIEAKARMAERIGGVALLLGAPELVEEATASVKGIGYMRRAGATNKQLLRAGAKLLPAWGTYAAPFATGAIVAKILRSRPERESRDSRSSTR